MFREMRTSVQQSRGLHNVPVAHEEPQQVCRHPQHIADTAHRAGRMAVHPLTHPAPKNPCPLQDHLLRALAKTTRLKQSNSCCKRPDGANMGRLTQAYSSLGSHVRVGRMLAATFCWVTLEHSCLLALPNRNSADTQEQEDRQTCTCHDQSEMPAEWHAGKAGRSSPTFQRHGIMPLMHLATSAMGEHMRHQNYACFALHVTARNASGQHPMLKNTLERVEPAPHLLTLHTVKQQHTRPQANRHRKPAVNCCHLPS